MNPTLRRHDFSPDSTATDYRGEPVGCVLCPLHRDHEVHADPPVDVSDRIVGEQERP